MKTTWLFFFAIKIILVLDFYLVGLSINLLFSTQMLGMVIAGLLFVFTDMAVALSFNDLLNSKRPS